MKNIYVVIGCTAAVLFLCCGKSSGLNGNSTKENLVDVIEQDQDSKTGYRAGWKIFKGKSELLIEQNEQKLAAFNETIEEAGPKALLMYRKKIALFEEKNIALKKKLKEFTFVNQFQLYEFKSTFERDLGLLVKSVDDVIKDNV